MQRSISVSASSPFTGFRSDRSDQALFNGTMPVKLRFCGLRRELIGFSRVNGMDSDRFMPLKRSFAKKLSALMSENRGLAKGFDYDLVIVGAGVGGHGAALQAVQEISKNASYSVSEPVAV